jgi:uncharacterized RDD family membrane protein YckC
MSIPPLEPPPVIPTPTQTPIRPQYAYAGFGRRWGAMFIDGIIVSLATFMISFSFEFTKGLISTAGNTGGSGATDAGLLITDTILSLLSVLINFGLTAGYYIYFIGKNGQTPGKKVFNIKVINSDTGLPPGYLNAFLREIIGKMVSAFLFGLGFIWMIWDDKKQTWHDKIANTIVIRS